MRQLALHDTGDLTCPRCGTSLAGLAETIETSTTDSLDEIRVDITCQNESCRAPLTLVIEPALPDAIGVDIWVEDRRKE